jgi:hypothetical protein
MALCKAASRSVRNPSTFAKGIGFMRNVPQIKMLQKKREKKSWASAS